jgi:hypothetical protein
MTIIAHLNVPTGGVNWLSLACRTTYRDRTEETHPRWVLVASITEANAEVAAFSSRYPYHKVSQTGEGWGRTE